MNSNTEEQNKEILRNLTIRPPESSNPIRFSTIFPLEFDFAEILRKNLSIRKIKTGVLPKNGWSDLKAIPGKFGIENIGCGIAAADISGSGNTDLVIFYLRSSDQQAFYRIGWDLDEEGNVSGWSDQKRVPVDFGEKSAGAGIAIGKIRNSSGLDMVVFYIDKKGNETKGKYAIGWGLDPDGNIAGWSDAREVPGWFGENVQGADIALADVSGTGRQDLIVFHIADREKENTGHYRIGWELNEDGIPDGDWSDLLNVPGEFSSQTQGAGIAVADVSGNGKNDVVFFYVDNPAKENAGYYFIGWDINASGNISKWSRVQQIDCWFGWETQGAGIAMPQINKDKRPDMLVFHIDNPERNNRGYYQIGWNMDVYGTIRQLGESTKKVKPATRVSAFETDWEVHNPGFINSNWFYYNERVYQSNREAGIGHKDILLNEIKQNASAAGSNDVQFTYKPDETQTAGSGTAVIYKPDFDETPQSLILKALLPETIDAGSGDTGLIFNWRDKDNYWVFCFRHMQVKTDINGKYNFTFSGAGGGESYTKNYPIDYYFSERNKQDRGDYYVPYNDIKAINCISILKIESGNVSMQQNIKLDQTFANPNEPASFTIDVVSPSLLRLTFGSGGKAQTMSLNLSLEGKIGLFSRYNTGTFAGLDVKLRNSSEPKILIPIGREVISEEITGFQKGAFDVRVIDNRPVQWIDILQRLDKEFEFSELRYEKAQNNFKNLFAERGDSSAGASPLPSPQDIENAERLCKLAFERKLKAQKELEEFSSFLISEGIPDTGDVRTTLAILKAKVKENALILQMYLKDSQAAECDVDMRSYRYIEGQYIDQYGETLHSHVIYITEHLDYTKEYLLLIPIISSAEDMQNPSRTLVVTNPVFSGKNIHPPTFFFEEKYQMGVKWTGIGLGEFSHSINLFPGEERELEITTTKKRTWESVSKTSQLIKSGKTSEQAETTKRNDSFESKLQDSFDTTNNFSSAESSSSSFGIGASLSASYGIASGSVNANYNANSSASSNTSLSSVAKKASDQVSKTGSEVSANNKVSFSTSSESQSSLEQKQGGEDTESEKSKIKISNINEGKTVNYNFYQVANNYATALSVENIRIHISTGIEIIPGTGLTIAKSYDLLDYSEILNNFHVFQMRDREEIVKAIAAQILKRYLFIPGDDIIAEDEPKIVKASNYSETLLKRMRNKARKIYFDPDKYEEMTEAFIQPFPDEFLDFSAARLVAERMQLGEDEQYSVNSGKYFVDAHVGVMPATEDYLEQRRNIETEKQKAMVEELKERTKAGVFFQQLPDSITTLSVNGENLKLFEDKSQGSGGSTNQ